MKKRILDIQLMNGPRTRESQGEHNTDSGGFDDGAEGLLIINAGTLSEASENPSGLVTIKRAISEKFVTINPFTGNNVHAWWTGNERPGRIGLESVKFRLHRGTPVGISESRAESLRRWGERGSMQVQAVNRLNETRFSTSPHAVIVDNRCNRLRPGVDGAATSTGSYLRRGVSRGSRGDRWSQ
jgi:hypothetical protein